MDCRFCSVTLVRAVIVAGGACVMVHPSSANGHLSYSSDQCAVADEVLSALSFDHDESSPPARSGPRHQSTGVPIAGPEAVAPEPHRPPAVIESEAVITPEPIGAHVARASLSPIPETEPDVAPLPVAPTASAAGTPAAIPRQKS